MTRILSPRRRVFELRVDVTGYLAGELKDWPAHIQDRVYAAMERLLKTTGFKTVKVWRSHCGRDLPTEPYYVIVTVVHEPEPVILQ
jgi:hypothetical protein